MIPIDILIPTGIFSYTFSVLGSFGRCRDGQVWHEHGDSDVRWCVSPPLVWTQLKLRPRL